MNPKTVLYTANIGGKDSFNPTPKQVPGVDYVYFTDNPNLKSSIWDVRQVPSNFPTDEARNARYYKVNPHKLFPEYDISVWVDSNINVIGDFTPLLQSPSKLQTYNHNDPFISDPRNCIYQEVEVVKDLLKDEISIVNKQISTYLRENYPPGNGLASTGIIVRHHNDPQIIACMDKWWGQITLFSKRDQLSFNYATWFTNTPHTYIPGNIRRNKYFKLTPHKTNY